MIQKTILIEDLVDRVPGIVAFLIDRGLPCIVCGQPIWGTLEEMARDKGRTDQEIEMLVNEINSTVLQEVHS